ncbi:MAG: Mrp/NBP35 family ATP-binding protein [Halobacteriales archaeon]
MTANTPEDRRAILQALSDAAIGTKLLPRSLTALDGFGRIRLEGRTVTVPVTLPIPSEAARTHIDREITAAVMALDAIDAVTCAFEPRVPDPGTHVDLIPDVKHVIAVASGKGGVGKSTVAVNLAAALAATGAGVGILDADVYGPNAPQMLGLGERKPSATQDDRMIPREAHGVSVMSMGFIAEEDDPVIWRGPLVDDFLQQLFDDVEWGALDYLIVDLPPGTGDAQLSLVQHLPVTGAVIVTTPEPVAVDDARRGLKGFARYESPILGIVENMAGFSCPDCGSQHDLFGTGGGDILSEEFTVPVLGQIPLDPRVGDLEMADDDSTDPPGVSIPGLGRLQLPRTRAEREQSGSRPPMVLREDGGETRRALELFATRTSARIQALTIDKTDADDG